MTHVDRARLQRLGIDPAQVTVGGVACEWCGMAIVDRFGAWCRAKGADENSHLCGASDDGLHEPGAASDLAVRVAKVMEMEAPEQGRTTYWTEGYEDALADVRATLKGES